MFFSQFSVFHYCIIVGCGMRIKLAMFYSMLITQLLLSFFQKLIKLQSFIASHGMRGEYFLFQGRKINFLMTKQFTQLVEHFNSNFATLFFLKKDNQIIMVLLLASGKDARRIKSKSFIIRLKICSLCYPCIPKT